MLTFCDSQKANRFQKFRVVTTVLVQMSHKHRLFKPARCGMTLLAFLPALGDNRQQKPEPEREGGSGSPATTRSSDCSRAGSPPTGRTRVPSSSFLRDLSHIKAELRTNAVRAPRGNAKGEQRARRRRAAAEPAVPRPPQRPPRGRDAREAGGAGNLQGWKFGGARLLKLGKSSYFSLSSPPDTARGSASV